MAKKNLHVRVPEHLFINLQKTAIDTEMTVTQVIERYLIFLNMRTLREKRALLHDKDYTDLRKLGD